MSALFSFKINIPKVEYFQRKQQRPTIHTYLIHTDSKPMHEPCKTRLVWDHFHDSHDYICPTKLPRVLDDGVAIAFDFYVDTQNVKGVWCRMHLASADFYLKDLFMKLSGKDDKRIQTDLGNNWIGIGFGTIELDLTNMFRDYELSFKNGPPLFFEDGAVANDINQGIGRLVRNEMGLFDGSYPMKPINGFLARVHAPIFQGRVSAMPGFAYVMNSTTLPATVNWFHRYYSQALERLNMKDADVKRIIHTQMKSGTTELVEGFHDCCLLLTTMISLTAACYPYQSDFYMSNGVQKPFESFDNVFVRRAGDCEDFARGMHFVLSTFQTSTISSKWGGMCSLQDVSNMYLSGIVLASVNTPQHGGIRGLFTSRQAHMYTQIFPIKYFIDNVRVVHTDYKDKQLFEPVKSKFKQRAWMQDLRVYVIEGTAPVQPFTSLESMASELDPLKQEFEVKSIKMMNATPHLPDGLQREFRPRWSVLKDDFYKNCAHFYTDYFIRHGVNVGSFAFYNDVKGTYGVDLQDVLGTSGFSFLPHQIFTDDDLQMVNELLSYEHPFPRLDFTSSSTLIDGGPQEVIMNGFITRMRAANAGKDQVEGTTELYNDFFIQSPHQRSFEDYTRIFDFFQERTVRQELYLEGFDRESAIFRIRAFGIK